MIPTHIARPSCQATARWFMTKGGAQFIPCGSIAVAVIDGRPHCSMHARAANP